MGKPRVSRSMLPLYHECHLHTVIHVHVHVVHMALLAGKKLTSVLHKQYVPAAPPTESAEKLEEKHVFLTYVAPVHYDALTLL